MHHPRYCPSHYPSISSNITVATHFRTPPTPLKLAQQPPYPRWHNTHVAHAGASLTLAGQPRNSRYQLFSVRFQWWSVNPKWQCSSNLYGATCDVLILHLPVLIIWERKAVGKTNGLGFGLFFQFLELTSCNSYLNFYGPSMDLRLFHQKYLQVLIFLTPRYIFYQCYGHLKVVVT